MRLPSCCFCVFVLHRIKMLRDAVSDLAVSKDKRRHYQDLHRIKMLREAVSDPANVTKDKRRHYQDQHVIHEHMNAMLLFLLFDCFP